MRAFIAIEIPSEVKKAALEIQNNLSRRLSEISWIENNNLHITVKFLGEISEENADKINKLILSIAGKTSVFKIKLETIGVFPSLQQARIIWMGEKNTPEGLKRMTEQLELNLESLGIPKENRPFTCHTTIGRIKHHIDARNLQDALDNAREGLVNRSLEFNAEGLTLFKSVLSAKSPTYIPLALAKFKTT